MHEIHALSIIPVNGNILVLVWMPPFQHALNHLEIADDKIYNSRRKDAKQRLFNQKEYLDSSKAWTFGITNIINIGIL